jgi:hypothetical protein
MKDSMNVKKPTWTPRIRKSNLGVRKFGGSDINQSTHLVDYTKSLNVLNFFYNRKKIGNTFKTWPTMCVSFANKGKT